MQNNDFSTLLLPQITDNIPDLFVGDFNMSSDTFFDLRAGQILASLDYVNLVSWPIHSAGNSIDFIVTKPHFVSTVFCHPFYYSDHDACIVVLP